MGTVPNDSTKFEIAWLIFWVILSTVLLVLAAIRKLTLPNLIKGDKIFSMVFTFLQLVIFVLYLAELGHNQWTYFSFPGGWIAYGVTETHGSGGAKTKYSDVCDIDDKDMKTWCQTIQTAGAFTLIFGLFGVITSFVLLILVALSLAGQAALAQFNKHIPALSNIQWICAQAMVIIWGVCGHDGIHQSNEDVTLGDSWAIAFCNTVFAITAALFFAGGPGVTATGATSPGPQQEAAVQPAATA